jgi:hypothetical protein
MKNRKRGDNLIKNKFVNNQNFLTINLMMYFRIFQKI